MGTNYYHHEKPACPTCGHHSEEPRHIGKSSAGWCFSLHIYPEDGIYGLKDWLARFGSGEIRDEYGQTVTPAEMRQRIAERADGLRRHPIDARHCIGHGEGPWDLIVGEFS